MIGKLTRRRFCLNIVATTAMAALPGSLLAKNNRAKPFVKWAGGKGQLIAQLSQLFPENLGEQKNLTYVEPFVGGGAMVFYMLENFPNIKRAIINDFNEDLMIAYTQIKEHPEDLIMRLKEIQSEYRNCDDEDEQQEYYLKKREEYNARPSNDVDVAALFIFLNRTCFNGLYRVNSKGRFNVPFGKAKNPLICDEETIRKDSELLQKVKILTGDFEGVYKHLGNKAFIYSDPPYRPLPGTPSFTSYSKDGFNEEQQKRLAAFCKKLDADGHKWLLSNSDPANTDKNDKFFDELYAGFDINRVSASRMINSKADSRGKITELAIRNYKE